MGHCSIYLGIGRCFCRIGWNAGLSQWESAPASVLLANIEDGTLNNDVLTWNTVAGEWQSVAPAAPPAQLRMVTFNGSFTNPGTTGAGNRVFANWG